MDMTTDEMDERQRQFLVELFRQTGGDPGVQVSMHAVGESMGLERSAASKVAEDLIGSGYVAVKTLSGGIGITEDGADRAHLMESGGGAAAAGVSVKLGETPVLDGTAVQAVERIVAGLKTHAAEKSWEFETLTELMADLKTIDAQLISPRPKTAIIRECLRSIKAVIEKAGADGGSLARIERLLGE